MRWAALVLSLVACADPAPIRYPSTLIVTHSNGVVVGRWCARGPIRSGALGGLPPGAYGFTDRATDAGVVVPIAQTVLSVRPDSTCVP